MNDLTYRLRNGFGSICGRASQVDGYQTISNEAADYIEQLEHDLRISRSNKQVSDESFLELASIVANLQAKLKAMEVGNA
jgi:hypothetical protein